MKTKANKNKYSNVWNVSEEMIKDAVLMEEIETFSKSIEFLSFENEKYNLKKDDWIHFKNGNDVPMIGKIFAFGKNNTAYMLWDCYWSSIRLEDRFISKIEI